MITNINNIPKELTKLKQWCVFKIQPPRKEGQHKGKIPINPITGKGASSNDPTTWCSFETASNALKQNNNYDGVGFFFNNDYIGIDVDDIPEEIEKFKHNPTNPNSLIYWLNGLIAHSYLEVSQSGKGIHAIVKGKYPFDNNRRGNYEIYGKNRFFALTGNILNTQKEIKLISKKNLKDLYISTVGKNQNNTPVETRNSIPNSNNLSIDEIINKMCASSNGVKIKHLMNGEYDYKSQSEADIALCDYLAFWTNKDAEKMDAIFRQTKLMRPKWDKKDGASTYGQRTIDKAITGTTETFNSSRDATAKDVYGFNKDTETKALKHSFKKFILTKDDKIKRNSIYNVVRILETDPIFKEAFKFNQFVQENEIVKNIPKLRMLKGYFEDSDIDEIANYIESSSKYDNVLFTKDNIRSAINTICKKHQYNPLKDYFDEAYKQWDGKPRIKNIFTDYLGADNSTVCHDIAIHFFSNAVAQVYEPGRKNDEALDLVGKQGSRKTEFFRRIAPLDLYTDSFTSFNKPDDLNEFRLSFIVNDDELAVSNKMSFEEVKKFTSKKELTFRLPYGHFPRTFKRSWVFVRTTNNLYYLRDLTGNRRFMPVLAHKDKIKKDIFAITENNKKQIWGEAVALYRKDLEKQKENKEFKGILHFSEDQEKEILNAQSQFTGTSSIEDQIDMLINTTSFVGQDFIKSSDLAYELEIDPVRDNKIMSKVSKIMVNKFNFKKKKRNGLQGFERL